MAVRTALVLIFPLLIVAAAVTDREWSTGDNEQGLTRVGRAAVDDDGCNSTTTHSLLLGGKNTYTFHTCFNESEGSLCLTGVPLPGCSLPLPLQCTIFPHSTNSLSWNITFCQNSFSSGYCFQESTVPICTGDKECVCKGNGEKGFPSSTVSPTPTRATPPKTGGGGSTTVSGGTVTGSDATPTVGRGTANLLRMTCSISLVIPALISALLSVLYNY